MNENTLTDVNEETSASGAVWLDPVLTLALAQASLAAYYDYENKPYKWPVNYRLIGRFTGWDDYIWSWGVEERFGLIFQYTGSPPAPNRYIVAFRGTDSWSDGYSDAFWEFANFQPYRNSVSPPPRVSAGFYDIYSTKGGSMTQSMQQQIFAMLPASATEVLITGHSLGATLSQLFTLDMRVSSPNVNIKNINFASPRVGDASWQAACSRYGATQRITRAINYWDIAPDYPLEISGYVSVGAQFDTSFMRCNWWDYNPLSEHSLLNLQTVLTNCVYLPNQIWIGQFQDAVDTSYWMCSTAPPQSAAAKQAVIAKLKELSDVRANASSAPEESQLSV